MSPKLFSPDARFFYLKCKKINFGWGLTVLPRHTLAGFGEGKGRRGREETRKKGERTGKWAGKREGGAMKGGKNGEGRKTWGK